MIISHVFSCFSLILVLILEKDTFFVLSNLSMSTRTGFPIPFRGFYKTSHYLPVVISLFEVPFISPKKEQELQEIW